MKIDYFSDTYIIYLNKYNTINIDFSNTKVLESDLKDLLLRLKRYYHIDIKGYYNITVYIDDFYGAILKIEEDNDYYDYFDDSIAIRMKKINTNFLYEIDDLSYIKDYVDKFDISNCNNKVYLRIMDKLSDKEYLELLEISNIIFEK